MAGRGRSINTESLGEKRTRLAFAVYRFKVTVSVMQKYRLSSQNQDTSFLPESKPVLTPCQVLEL